MIFICSIFEMKQIIFFFKKNKNNNEFFEKRKPLFWTAQLASPILFLSSSSSSWVFSKKHSFPSLSQSVLFFVTRIFVLIIEIT